MCEPINCSWLEAEFLSHRIPFLVGIGLGLYLRVAKSEGEGKDSSGEMSCWYRQNIFQDTGLGEG